MIGGGVLPGVLPDFAGFYLEEEDLRMIRYLYAHPLARPDMISHYLRSTVSEVSARLQRLVSGGLVLQGPIPYQYMLSDPAAEAVKQYFMAQERWRDYVVSRVWGILPTDPKKAIKFRSIRHQIPEIPPRELMRGLNSLIRLGKAGRTRGASVSGRYRYYRVSSGGSE